MLILRLRQAETALHDGRLDEAYEIARSADVREHRRGQDLIGRLARALVARGGEHLGAGRLPLATADADKAAMLAGNLPEIAALRLAITQAAIARHDEDRRVAGALGAARDRIRSGELSMGEGLLAPLPETGRADLLRGEAAARRQEVDALLARADEAMRREDWACASELLSKAGQLHSTNPRVGELSAQAAGQMLERTLAAMSQGRLDRARCLLAWAQAVSPESIELLDLRGALELCLRAAAATRDGQHRRAVEALQRVRAVLPDAVWVAEAIGEAQRAAEAVERLRGGPLGGLMADSGAMQGQQNGIAGRLAESRRGGDSRQTEVREAIPAPADRIHAPEDTPRGLNPAARYGTDDKSRFMLHVDGVGSFLVLRERSVTIGPAGGSRQPDVALLVDGAAGTVTIDRADEDYFLTGGPGTTVNHVAMTRKLLADCDRIGLASKCHIKFTVPNAASTSALLSIAGARMPGTDATRVILLQDALVIGPGPSAHVRCDDLAGPVILHARDGRLFCRADEAVLVDGRPADRQAGLPLGAQVRIGPLSMVVRTV